MSWELRGGHTRFEPHDVVIIYGREKALARLDERRPGQIAQREHAEAVAEQKIVRGGAAG